MHEFTLRFPDESAAVSALFEQVMIDGVTRRLSRYAAIDVIGIIRRPTGAMIDSQEGPVPEMAPIEGWHVNVRHTAPAPELEPYAVQVTNPVRRWA